MAGVIQVATTSNTTTIPGGNFGPGTRWQIGITLTFGSAITAGSGIVVAIAGNITLPGLNISLGPFLASVNTTGGGLVGSRTEYFAATITDSSGTETMIGPIVSIFIPSGDRATLSPLNVNTVNLPTGATWSVYANTGSPTGLTLQASGLGAGTGYTEPSSGLVIGTPPPTQPIHDNQGNTYASALWTDGGAPGSQFGEQAMGVFYAANVAAGSTTVDFVCGAFNEQPAASATAALCVVAAEVAAIPSYTTQDAASFQTDNSGAADLSIAVTNSASATITTDFGSQVQVAATVADLIGGGAEVYYALLTGGFSFTPATPTLTGGTYTLLGDVPESANGTPLWVWISVSLACGNPPNGTIGVPYTHAFPAGGGYAPYTFSITGTLPPGLTLNTSTGVVSGTPTTNGIYPFSVTVTDSTSPTPIMISICCAIWIVPPSAPANYGYTG